MERRNYSTDWALGIYFMFNEGFTRAHAGLPGAARVRHEVLMTMPASAASGLLVKGVTEARVTG